MRVGSVAALQSWAPLAPAQTKEPCYGHLERTELGPLRTGALGLVLAEKRALADIDDMVTVFPAGTREAVSNALKTSVRRAVESHRAGRISALDAAASLEMVRELVELMDDLGRGNVELLEHEVFDDRVQRWVVRAPDGDQLVVVARPYADEREARLSVRLEQDDGVELPSRYRMAARIDLDQHAGAPRVDVQFGGSALDKRIHGLFRNAAGVPITGPTGREIADHHFRANLDPALAEPTRFAAMVRAFIDDVMTPLG